jgi:hypothetical protein
LSTFHDRKLDSNIALSDEIDLISRPGFHITCSNEWNVSDSSAFFTITPNENLSEWNFLQENVKCGKIYDCGGGASESRSCDMSDIGSEERRITSNLR